MFVRVIFAVTIAEGEGYEEYGDGDDGWDYISGNHFFCGLRSSAAMLP